MESKTTKSEEPKKEEKPKMRELTKEEKNSALMFTAGIMLFAVLGILAAVIFKPAGIGVLGPLLVGPGISIFFLGVLYESSLGPFLHMNASDELTDKIKYAYMALGALFVVMGFFAWVLG